MEEKRPDEMEMAKKKDEKREEKKSKKISMNKIYIFFSIFLLLISGCTQEYKFKDAVEDIKKIDAKYNCSIYTDALDKENKFSELTPATGYDWNRTNIKIENVEPILNELSVLEESIKLKQSEDFDSILLLIGARKNMILSQKSFMQGLSFGIEGDARDGFKCGESDTVLLASDYFNQSVIIGKNVTKALDYLLMAYPESREHLSDTNRPKFYNSPFYFIEYEAERNANIVTNLCKDEE